MKIFITHVHANDIFFIYIYPIFITYIFAFYNLYGMSHLSHQERAPKPIVHPDPPLGHHA